MRYLALDFETSGLNPNEHAPVSLGVALFESGEVITSKQWTISPPRDKSGKISRAYDVVALQISGITWKAIQEGTPISVVMLELSEWAFANGARDLAVVAFNAPFDLSWYSTCLFLGGSWNQHRRCFETFKPPLIGPWQCARLLACDSMKLDRYDLDGVAKHFGLARETEAHGALEDAILAGKIYDRLTTSNAERVVA